MVSIVSLWLPILLAAVGVFVASSVIHMLLSYHQGDYLKLPDEDGVADALRGFDIPPGDYMIPRGDDAKAMNNPEAVRQLKRIPEVLECHYTTGHWSILIKVLCKDNEHLMQILNKKIQSIEGVSRTETFISLNQQIDRQIRI